MDKSHLSRRPLRADGSQNPSPTQEGRPDEPAGGLSSLPGRAASSVYKPTIRSVTPDSIPEGDVARSSRSWDISMGASPPISPRTSSQRASPRSTVANPRALVARSTSNDGDYSLRSLRDSQNRPRTRTLEERTSRDKSPGTLFNTGRHRVGSVHSAGSYPHSPVDEAVVTSIGHISTISPTTPSSSHPLSVSTTLPTTTRPRASTKHPPRTASPLAHIPSKPDSWVAPVPASDARKILKLMRATCGKMQGMLAFRRGDSNPWSLSYCYINEDSGSLVYEPKSDTSYHRTLIPDLRGCKVRSAYDAESYTAYIHVGPHNSSLEVHLRPPTQEEFDSWFAALLCWQPIQPRGIQNKMAKPQIPLGTDRRLTADSRRHSEVSLLKEAPIIKVGKMIYWDATISYSASGMPNTTAGSSSRPPAPRQQSVGSRRWRRVSCTLRENGELKLYSDTDITLISVVQLSQLSRCAIQRLDPSVLSNEFTIAIYPQYSTSSNSLSLIRPIFLSLETRVLYEVWIVLLRAFTIPQLYGPKHPVLGEDNSPQAFVSPNQDMFRMERSLSVRVIEAKLLPPVSPKSPESASSTGRPHTGTSDPNSGGYYVEILLDSETRARTVLKNEGTNPFWREDFEFADLPAVLSTATLLLKKRPPERPINRRGGGGGGVGGSSSGGGGGEKSGSGQQSEPKVPQDAFVSPEGTIGVTGISFDQTCGKCDIYLDDLGEAQELERWWPLMNMYGNTAGEALVRVKVEETVILMARDYQPLSELLHRFSNGLTLQLAVLMPNELKRLSEILLDIFQVSGQASEWIKILIEEEIDGTLKDGPSNRMRFSRRLGSSDSGDSFGSSSDRELVVRDLGNNAKLEANLLFRGNTLLTKALDHHMKRLGKEYLEETLCEKLKEISDRDPDCEVDPNRVTSQSELDKNWRRLNSVTEELWRTIYNSASRCPQELRVIFRHVRACAEDRFGDFLRTVSYSSVSGFLFLRFFCPAVLNPKLFGLLKDHPKARARRTLTLVAKSLQGLANMSTFGAKEHWMEPMNTFLSAHRQEFKDFIDMICNVPSAVTNISPIPPSYSTPLAILQRLPPTSREGFPSLPYLIDHARSFAALVELWLEQGSAKAHVLQPSDGDLLRFHTLCVSLQQRTSDCLDRAERAERPSSSLSVKWEELVEQLQDTAILEPHSPQFQQNPNAWGAVSQHSKSQTQSPTQSESSRSFKRWAAENTDQEEDEESMGTPLTMKNASHRKQSPAPIASSGASTATPGSSRYTASVDAVSVSASASASVSAAEDTPPGSRDGSSIVPPISSRHVSESRSHWASFANHKDRPRGGVLIKNGRRPGSAKPFDEAREEEVSGDESPTTALPQFGEKERLRAEKEREKEKGLGLRSIPMPFKKRKEKG